MKPYLNITPLTSLVSLLSVTLLTACGGSGGGSTESSSNTGTTTSLNKPAFQSLAGHSGKCVVDTANNLIWEVKQTSGLHQKDHTYSWYNSKAAAGKQGKANGGTCESSGRCDTEKFVEDVNTASWCGFTDWRLPTKAEFVTLIDNSKTPTINTAFFPNTATSKDSFYWTSESTETKSGLSAKAFNFYYAINSDQEVDSFSYRVRLVRNKK